MPESLCLLLSHSLTMYVSVAVYLAHLYVPLPIYPIRYMYPCFSHCQIPSACIRSSASTTPGRRYRGLTKRQRYPASRSELNEQTSYVLYMVTFAMPLCYERALIDEDVRAVRIDSSN